MTSARLPLRIFALCLCSFASSALEAQTPAQTSSQTPTQTTTQTPALPDAPSAATHTEPAAVPTGPTVLFDTSMGRLTCQLFDKEAPLTTANFVGLATGAKPFTDPATRLPVTSRLYYNGTQFHRVIPGFMIQGGDPLGSGMGDAGFYIPDEISPSLRFDVPGRLAMANSGPNTNSSQFFITELPKPELNGHYTIFGQCDPHSVLLVASIARVERDSQDKPLSPVLVNKVTVLAPGAALPPEPAQTTAPATTPVAPATTATPAPAPTPQP